MYIVTGGAGFIGSALVWKLNELGIDDIIVVDRMGTGQKWKNLAKRKVRRIIHKDELFTWLEGEGSRAMIEGIFHMGASSSTVEADSDYLVRNNLNYSVRLWQYCSDYNIPFVYASSASTYGEGERGFSDDLTRIDALRPMHPYGFSKQKFDQWALMERRQPPVWAGLKFFNVYGPQEYHKGSQSSVVFQFVPQIKETGVLKLFKSHRPDFGDGEQKRDFVYVKDCVDVAWHFLASRKKAKSGIYNVGTGKARTFADLGRAVFKGMGVNTPRLEFVEMPEKLRDQYQYFTEADLKNLREFGGYQAEFTPLEAGVTEYVSKYLTGPDAFL